LQALKGRPNEAQAIGLDKRSRRRGLQAPKGRSNKAQANGLAERNTSPPLAVPLQLATFESVWLAAVR
jgi:hypothetical protein